jgi:hypothetical protein
MSQNAGMKTSVRVAVVDVHTGKEEQIWGSRGEKKQ